MNLPTVIAAMMAAGASAPMIVAACRAAFEEERAAPAAAHATAAATPATFGPVACNVASVAPRSSTQRSRDSRARKRAAALQRPAVACNVASVAPPGPLSLSETTKTKTPSLSREAVSISDDWQPNDAGRMLGLELLGEAGAAACLAKFRDHWQAETGPRSERTPTQWQAGWRKWVRAERSFTASPQRNLPLVRHINGGRHHGPKSLAATADELIARAEERAARSPPGTGPPGNGFVASG